VKAGVYKNYLLIVLLVILAFNSVDGLALGLVLQDIKVDLSLTDSQLGLLSGIAFALFYSIMGIPIARWADRGNRVTIISLTTAVWSVMVALCGFAASFAQLMLIRIGVGVGEAGCVPPAHSLMADYFARAERPRAVSIYMQGNTLSFVIGYFVAGWLNEWYGWRTAFILLGLIGLVPAALARFTLTEPRRAKIAADAPGSVASTPLSPSAAAALPPAAMSLKVVCSVLWASTTFRHLLYSFAAVYFFSSGISQWTPTFFTRSYGLKTGEVGTWFMMIYGVGGMLGMYVGGEWASRRAADNERLQLRAIAIVYCAYTMLSTIIYLSPNHYLAFAMMGLGSVVSSLTVGPLFATIQSLVPPRMRAMSIAIIYLFANLIGLGLGPLAVGALSDALRPLLGVESLRYALLALCPGYLWVAWHLWRAGESVTRDLAAVDRETSTAAPKSTTDEECVDACPNQGIYACRPHSVESAD